MFFPTTCWTSLAHADLNGDTAGRKVVNELCNDYWLPVYEFIRARKISDPEAQDLTQEFMLHLLENSIFSRADRLRGRFRSFLLGALVRFLADVYDRRMAQKRGQGAVHLEVDHGGLELVSLDDTKTFWFDREWAMAVLENALNSLEAEYRAANRQKEFVVLRAFLPGSLTALSYEDAAMQLGLSLSTFKSEVHRLRQRLKTFVRQAVARSVGAPHEVEEEMTYLRDILMDRHSALERGALTVS